MIKVECNSQCYKLGSHHKKRHQIAGNDEKSANKHVQPVYRLFFIGRKRLQVDAQIAAGENRRP